MSVIIIGSLAIPAQIQVAALYPLPIDFINIC